MSRTPDLGGELDRLQTHLPRWTQSTMRRALDPAAVWVRIPLALVLMVGGVLGIVLPVLGFWMVPLGLALLALDIPFLRGPLARLLAMVNNRLAPQDG